ncbi:MAG: matrixin family metalloprotease [Thermacetogeniaceae bacterium]
MRRKLLTILLSVLIVLSMMPLQSASAYTLEGYTWEDPTPVTYWWDTTITSATSRACWQNGASAWNNATSRVSFSYNSNYEVYLGATNDDNISWDGITALYASGNTITSADCYLNEYYTNGYSSAKRQSVSTHELGHVLGLGHSNGARIMNPYTDSRWDTYGVNTPQTDDLNGINAMY